MSNKTMQAARAQDYGGADQMIVEQVAVPEPGEGQVLVRLKAAGVNPADWKFRQGNYRQYMPLQHPWTPGLEGAGTIEAVGAGANGVQVGQAVYGPFNASYAEYTVVPAAEVFPKPENLSFEQAASVPVGALTAWQAVVEEAEVEAGQKVLVHGGAGGVGLYAVQLAKWKGAYVIATSSGGNADYVRSLGADEVINYQTTKFEDVVKDVDAVIDTVGGELIQRSLHVIRSGGKFVTIAGMVDPEAGAARDILATSARRADASKLQQISELLQSKKLKSEVGKTFPLSKVRQAMELSETGHGRGRIVLIP